MPSELDPTMNPEMGEPMDAPVEPSANDVIGTHGEPDREGAMAKADLFKLANYAHKLYQQIHDDDQLESWVQAKITKAADYIASVYHYLEYEMKFSEYGKHLDNAETMNEGERSVLKARLMEAKMKISELKKAQAEKVAEEKSSTGGTITRPKAGVTRHTHNPDRFSDEPHAEPASKVKARSAGEKADEKAQDKADEKESKAWGKANPGKQTIMKGGVKTTNEAKKAKKDYDQDGKVESGKDEYLGSKIRAAKKAGKLKEGTCSVCKKDPCACKKEKKCNECGMYESKCGCSMKESAKPSAGLSKAKKSATVKDAKAGKDIGKPGKGFDKLAKKAGGGEKGEKIAAAAMWKNIKETTSYLAEKKKKEKITDENLTVVPNPSGAKDAEEAKKLGAMMPKPAGSEKDPIKEGVDRIRELTGRLNLNENHTVKKANEVDQLKALTNLFKG